MQKDVTTIKRQVSQHAALQPIHGESLPLVHCSGCRKAWRHTSDRQAGRLHSRQCRATRCRSSSAPQWWERRGEQHNRTGRATQPPAATPAYAKLQHCSRVPLTQLQGWAGGRQPMPGAAPVGQPVNQQELHHKPPTQLEVGAGGAQVGGLGGDQGGRADGKGAALVCGGGGRARAGGCWSGGGSGEHRSSLCAQGGRSTVGHSHQPPATGVNATKQHPTTPQPRSTSPQSLTLWGPRPKKAHPAPGPAWSP